MPVYLADIRVQLNHGVRLQVIEYDKNFKKKKSYTSKNQFEKPHYMIVKDIIVNTTNVNNLTDSHLSRIYASLDYSKEKLIKHKNEGRLKIVSIDKISEPLGLVK